MLLGSRYRPDVAVSLTCTRGYADEERYTVSDTKTKSMIYNSCSEEEAHFSVKGTDIENVNSYKHLGIIRKSKVK